MNEIKSVKELIKALDESVPADRKEIIAKLNLDSKELLNYATWKKQGYTRNCLARSEDYEIILLCWDQKAVTPIHGHGGQDCWVYQVNGKVLEMRFTKNDDNDLQLSEKLILGDGDISYMTDEMGYHLIKNNSKESAMTLHVYAGPIDECEVYCNEENNFKCLEMEYDCVFDEEVLVEKK